MSVLRRAKLRTPDGTESIEYPLGVEAENVKVTNEENLSQRLVRIDRDLNKNEEDITAVNEIAGANKQNIGKVEIRVDALEKRNVSAKDILFNNGYNIQETIGDIDVDNDGSIEFQLEKIDEKVTNDKTYGMKINSTRLYRKLFQTGFNIINPEGNYYSNNQGFCMIDENTAALALIEGSKNFTNDYTRLIIVNIKTGAIIKETIGEFGHANDMSYNPDENVLYIGGCSTYNASGQLTENKRLIILNYSDLSVKQIYIMPNIIAGVTYDRINKKLYTNNHSVVYELNKENYNIIKTINLENSPDNAGSVGQTVKIFGDRIYRVTAWPNQLNIFNMNGKWLNKFCFNDYMDDCYYIGEVETFDMLNDYIYFNSQIRSLDPAPYAMVSIGKTSLRYSIANNNKWVNNSPCATLSIHVDNSKEIVNPNGETVELAFQELCEAIIFCSSPAVRKYNCMIYLEATNIEYASCKIVGCPNLSYIETNQQTLNTCRIYGMPNLTFSRANWKGTIVNNPIVDIRNSKVKFYRPNFINNNTGNNYAIVANTAWITLDGIDSGGSATFDQGLYIYLDNSTTIHSSHALKNIIKTSSAPKIEKMLIYDGSLKSSQQIENYTCDIGTENILEQISRYRYIVFVVSGTNYIKHYKYSVLSNNPSGVQYRICDSRSNNNDTAMWIRYTNFMLKLTASNIQVEYGKQITLDFDNPANNTCINSDFEAKISSIYLTDM